MRSPEKVLYQGTLYGRVASLAEKLRWFPKDSLWELLTTLSDWPARKAATLLWHDGDQRYLLIQGPAEEEAVAHHLSGGDREKFTRTLRQLRPVAFNELETKGRREHVNTIDWSRVRRFFQQDVDPNV